MKLSELNLLAIGNTIQIVGAVYAGDGKMIIALFPEDRGALTTSEGEVLFLGKDHPPESSFSEAMVQVLDMDLGDWQKFLRQTDVMETEILTKSSDGTLAKAIYRKSQRQIDQAVSWKVFKRDSYTCRYCGNNDVPLTVDHLILWEDGGPSTTDNLVAACKKCNKTRGNTDYEAWMKHPYYVQVSKSLDPVVRALNEELVGKIRFIHRNVHTRSRG
jgi:HNH endonuclease